MSSVMTGSQELVRADWISACHFHDLTVGQVLDEVARKVHDLKTRAGGNRQAHPLVLLDLDSTLYEVGPRSFYILREWAETSEAKAFPGLVDAIRRLELKHVGYSLADTFSAIGLDLAEAAHTEAGRAVKAFWLSRFFTSAYLTHDKPYPTAAEFAWRLHELGAEVVYLTGRDEPNMGDGTRKNLLRDGFPWDVERTHLLMKAKFEVPDLDHKKQAAEYIRTHGTLVASFENEPKNLVAIYDLFPEAMHVFVETVCSDHGAEARQGLYRIPSFIR